MWRRSNWTYIEEPVGEDAPPSPPWRLGDSPVETCEIRNGQRISKRAEKVRAEKSAKQQEEAQKRAAAEAKREVREAERRVNQTRNREKKRGRPRTSAPAVMSFGEPDPVAVKPSISAAARVRPERIVMENAEMEAAGEGVVRPVSIISAARKAPAELAVKVSTRPGDALRAIRSGGADIAADLKLLQALDRRSTNSSLDTPSLSNSVDADDSGFASDASSELSSLNLSDDETLPPIKRARKNRALGLLTPAASVSPSRRKVVLKGDLKPGGQDRKAFLTAGLYSHAYKAGSVSECSRRASAPAPGSLGYTKTGAPRRPAPVLTGTALPLPINFGATLLEPKEPRDFRLPFDIYADYAMTTNGDPDAEKDRLERLGKGRKPEPYEKIRTNQYPFRKVEKSDMPPAICTCIAGNCTDGCMNAMMQYLCNSNCPRGAECANGPLHLRKGAIEQGKGGLQVFFTGNRGFGLRTEIPLKTGQFVLEYRGEVISRDESYRRVNNEYAGMKNFYFLDYDGYDVLDAGRKGNCARFINHSCQPNLIVIRFKLSGLEEYQIGLFASRDIAANEELTYDYAWQDFKDLAPSTSHVRSTLGGEDSATSTGTDSDSLAAPAPSAQMCFCGAANCKGLLGGKKKKADKRGKEKELLKRAKAKKRKRKTSMVTVEQTTEHAVVAGSDMQAAETVVGVVHE